MIVGCYALDLYCDNEEAHKDEYPMTVFNSIGRSREECLRSARKAGWSVDLKRWVARCPRCRRKRLTKLFNS